MGEAPILVVCSARHDLLEAHPDWAEAVEGATRIALEPLTGDEAGMILDHLLGGASLPADARRRITDAAAGHPLYVEQFLSMLIDDGRLRPGPGAWVLDLGEAELAMPPTISALLTARIDRLDPSERAVAERGAVIGTTFYRGAVEELAPEPMRDQVGPLLLDLTGKRLVRPADEFFANEETFQFRHALIGEAAYNGLLKRARAELHERFADWLERVTVARQLELEEILGYHLEQAYRYRSELGPLDPEGQTLAVRAAQRLAAAGRRAFARGDMPAASNLLGRAVALLPETNVERQSLQCDLAEALLDLGELAEAERVADQAIGVAERLGDQRRVIDASLVRLLVRFVTDSDGWSDAALSEANRAIPVLEEFGDHASLAKAWRLLGSVYGMACRYGEAEHAIGQSIDHARLAGDRRQEVRVLPHYATSALYGPTPVSLALERCEQILAQEPGDLRAEGMIRCTLAQLRAMRGEFAEARRLYRLGRETFTQLGGKLLIASTSLDSGRVELMAGNPEAAIRELAPDEAALEQIGERYLRSTIAGLLARAEELSGRLDDADAHAMICEELAAPDDVESQAQWRGVRARLLARLGEVALAEQRAREAVELTRTTEDVVMQADAMLDLAAVLEAAGDHDGASLAAGEAAALYEGKGHLVGLTAARRHATASVGESSPVG
jgi:tetratricopeptide (TPR) repeat protein